MSLVKYNKSEFVYVLDDEAYKSLVPARIKFRDSGASQDIPTHFPVRSENQT